MTAHYRTTATDLANAISGRPPQDVRVVKTTFTNSGFSPRYVVLVGGEYYEVYGFTKRALENGFTPEELELVPLVDDDEEQDDDFCMNTTLHTRASGWRGMK
jgi:hypothetical protein